MRNFMSGFEVGTLSRMIREKREVVGCRLKMLRMSHGLTQRALGECVGVSDTCISQWEKGKYHMRPIYVMVFAHMFKVDERYLWDPHYKLKRKRPRYKKDLEEFVHSLDCDKREILYQMLTSQ